MTPTTYLILSLSVIAMFVAMRQANDPGYTGGGWILIVWAMLLSAAGLGFYGAYSLIFGEP